MLCSILSNWYDAHNTVRVWVRTMSSITGVILNNSLYRAIITLLVSIFLLVIKKFTFWYFTQQKKIELYDYNFVHNIFTLLL